MEELTRIGCDVLIIGSGGAGLRAAIAAREAGADALLVSKSPLGFATCTMYAAAAFAFAVVGGMTEEEHFEATMRTGRGLNDEKLVRILCQEGPAAVRELERFGVELRYGRAGADTRPYVTHPLRGGEGITREMVAYARRIGVRVQDRVIIVELLKQDGEIGGAIGLDGRTGDLFCYETRAVVLASGGVGALFPRTDNPLGITGDGYALAYQAGAPLQDMEFVQMYPTGVAEGNRPTVMIPLSYMDFCPITNVEGKEFLRAKMEELGIKDGREANLYMRDLATRAIGLEIYKGRGESGAVLMDFSQVTAEQCEKHRILGYLMEKLLRRFPHREQPLHVAPVAHHTMGGVRIDESGASDRPGLFCAGEVTGGVHGANRRGGNALTDTMVFGRRAGEAAADWARKRRETTSRPVTALTEAKDRLKRLITQGRGSGCSPQEWRDAVRRVAGDDLFIVRSEEGLKEALQRFEELGRETVSATRPRELMTLLEARNLLAVGELIARAALYRQESRGAHFRIDYPEQQDDEWSGHILLQKTLEGVKVSFNEQV